MNFLARLQRFGKAASHDRWAYHEYQIQIGNYYLEQFVKPYANGKKVLDIGCAEGGVLIAFEKQGYDCTGLEYSLKRIEYAREKSSSKINFINGDIEQFSYGDKFDVILLLDVIEHLNKKLQALENIKRLVLPGGIVIVSFPPFRSPYGGHQQIMRSFLKFIPYIHLLPVSIYRWLVETVERVNVDYHFRNYETGITIRQFEQLINQAGFKLIKKISYFVRPRQAFRFDIKIKENRISLFQEYLTTGVVYILG